MESMMLVLLGYTHMSGWYDAAWWVSIREVITVGSMIVGLLAAGVALATFVNTLAVEKQELSAKRFRQTVAVIEDYNEKRIAVLAKYAQEMDDFLNDIKFSDINNTDKHDDVRLYLNHAAATANASEVLHYLNLLGFFLENEQYIAKEDLLQSFESEIHYYFSNPEYQYPIVTLMRFTSMRYVNRLFNEVGIEISIRR
ncbi:hypothetical protein [Lacticaseibacillus sharpeae]|uniref:Phage abortive infection protein n=1 Tax=Lacticaseibacillus sharpeae JCM 1186 = DSM 20505 TaxID=1291052 RepID=A0A0R1ZWK7_9LACO|nr:hypothetical protein [Lacticaseibacillus sharpeae]KRM55459.1 hypothetical protein FC18_GL001354 [Lacticaseibacillus sharpeae JCM 1186 = DSM 20505]